MLNLKTMISSFINRLDETENILNTLGNTISQSDKCVKFFAIKFEATSSKSICYLLTFVAHILLN